MKKTFKIKRHQPWGFTLIELLIVITIIGILAVALIPRLTGGTARARDAQRKSDLLKIAEALEFYASDNGGNYPSLSSGIFDCTDTLDLSAYLSITPSDPSGAGVGNATRKCSTNYTYFPIRLDGSDDPNSYMLFALLENETIADDSAYSSTFQNSLVNTSDVKSNLALLSTCDDTSADCSTGAMFVVGH